MTQNNFVIKGLFDDSELKRSVSRVSGLLESSFDKKGRTLFDPDTMKLLSGGFQAALQKASGYMGKLTSAAKQLDDALQDSNITEEKRNKLLEQRLTIQDKIVSTQRKLTQIRSGQGELERGRRTPGRVVDAEFSDIKGKGRMLGGQIAGGMRQLPGAGPIAGAAIGMSASIKSAMAGITAMGVSSALAATGIGALAAGAVAATYGISRAVAGFQAYTQVVPDILTREAVGAPGLQYQPIARQLGFGMQETMQAQIGATRAFGKAESPEAAQARTETILGFGRAAGINPQQITQMGGNLRGTMGTDRANREMATLMERSFTKSIDKSQIPFFLEASVQLLSTINESGVGNTDKLMDAMASMLEGTQMAPERAARLAGGIQQAISGAQGESNAFFQMAMAGEGLGGGTLLGAQFAVRQGLVGVDRQDFMQQMGADDATAREGGSMLDAMGLTDPQFTQKAARGILNRLESRGGKGFEGQQGMAKLGFMNQMFGGNRTATELFEIVKLLRKAAGPGLTAGEQTTLQELGKDKTLAWQDDILEVMNTTAGQTKSTAESANNIKITLGQTVAPTVNSLLEMQAGMDSKVGDIVSLLRKQFGIPDPAEESTRRQEGLMRNLQSGYGTKGAGMGTGGFGLGGFNPETMNLYNKPKSDLTPEQLRDLAGKGPLTPSKEELEKVEKQKQFDMEALLEPLKTIADNTAEMKGQNAEVVKNTGKTAGPSKVERNSSKGTKR